MGYETEVPPVPTRDEEIEMIGKIKKSFLDQPSYKFYMNESLRLRKLHDVEKINNFRRTFTSNFCRGLLYSSFILLPISLLYRRTSSGVPMFFQPKHFVAFGGYDFPFLYRNFKILRFYIPAAFLVAYTYASVRTSHEGIFDEYMEDKAVILPY